MTANLEHTKVVGEEQNNFLRLSELRRVIS